MAEIINLTPVSLTSVTSAQTAINSNFTAIQTAFNDVLSRSGVQPNSMVAPLDMNSQQIINLPPPNTSNSPIRLQDANLLTSGGSVILNNLPVGGLAGQILVKNSSANYDASWSGALNLTTKGSWYTDAGAHNAFINKVRDRLLVDDGCLYDGSLNELGLGLFPNSGAAAAINNIGWNWAPQSSIYVLSSQSLTGITAQTTSTQTPVSGGPLPIAVNGMALNDQTISNSVTTWGGYFEGGLTGAHGAAFGIEIDVGNTNPAHSTGNNYTLWANSGSGGNYDTIGIQLASGGSMKPTTVYQTSSAAIAILGNPGDTASTNANWDRGIVFTPKSIFTHSGLQYAINMAPPMALVWWANNSGNDLLDCLIYDSAGVLNLKGNTGLALTSNSGAITFNQSLGVQTVPNGLGTLLSTAGAVQNLFVASPVAGNSSATPVMMGMGSTIKITPKFSSRVLVEIYAQAANTVSSSTPLVTMYYGAGSAPSNGASVTGAQASQQNVAVGTIPVANGVASFSLPAIVTGLTPGTQYWFDIALSSFGGSGTSTLGSVGAILTEI